MKQFLLLVSVCICMISCKPEPKFNQHEIFEAAKECGYEFAETHDPDDYESMEAYFEDASNYCDRKLKEKGYK